MVPSTFTYEEIEKDIGRVVPDPSSELPTTSSFQRMKRIESGLKKPDLLSTMKAKLDEVEYLEFPIEFPLASHCSIYRVPPRLRKVNEDAYTPSLVSIGPFHHGDQRLESMEDIKLWFLKKFLKRNPKKSLEDYVDEVGKKEDEIRRCYSEIIPMESNEFVSMITTDACFIIEYFLTCQGPRYSDSWRPKHWPNSDIALDLILLENQLPFFVLKDLFDLFRPEEEELTTCWDSTSNQCSFLEVAFDNIKTLLPEIVPNATLLEDYTFKDFEHHHLTNNDIEPEQVKHLCDLLRIFYLRFDRQEREQGEHPSQQREQGCKMCSKLRSFCFPFHPQQSKHSSEEREQGCKVKLCDKLNAFCFRGCPQLRREYEHLPQEAEQGRKMMKLAYCASKLHEAGVEFKVNDGASFNQLRFSRGVLKIPSICITDLTEVVIRNVIAFEQCHLPETVLTNYIIFLDDLINSEKDVEMLVEKGIMRHMLGDNNAVASMVNKLCVNVETSPNDGSYPSLGETCKHLNMYYEDTYHKHRAIFMHEYWGTPWKKTSLLAAILLLVLTLTQTVCSIISLT
ncbi:UPF0481 protein At3g47200-like isoform X2 [Prosopis cineraria]|uniref:UPF0481 protein At3g47200-like isoform X2 n=1 Tax=Prosopis cineraria TaxID=364024 RepID=UPI00240FA155|nr:UPF0481 protein At3g47200-like isoform X2 [Prosopis cineraria]